MREDFFYRIHVIQSPSRPFANEKTISPCWWNISSKMRTWMEKSGPCRPTCWKLCSGTTGRETCGELQNVLHRYLAIGRLDFLAASDTPPGQAEVPFAPDITRDSPHLKTALERFERQYIISLLDTHHWNRSRVAGLLGIFPANPVPQDENPRDRLVTPWGHI
jgi:hypothetical protein